jgi:hypothetical protein
LQEKVSGTLRTVSKMRPLQLPVAILEIDPSVDSPRTT